MLTIVLGSVIAAFYMLPAGPAVESRQFAITQLYLAEYRDRSSWFRAQLDRAMSHVSSIPVTTKPVASVSSGIYESALNVQLTANTDQNEIFYTLDGAIPTRHSKNYLQPINITETSVLRARVISPGGRPGAITTEAYIIGEDIQLPIISVTSDPSGLFDPYAGIYRNPFLRGKGWRREAVVTHIPQDRETITHFDAEISIHGNYTRELRKKSLRIRYVVDERLQSRLPEILRSHRADQLHQVVMRQGGDDFEVRLRGRLFDSLYQELGGITAAYEPVFVFINGQAQGVYNIREYISVELLEKRFGSDEYDLIVDNERALAGDFAEFSSVIEFLESHDLALDENFNAVARQLDVSNIMDYWIANIYAANVDWPAHNTYFFRSNRTNTKWRAISWDVDVTFDRYGTELQHNTLPFAIRDNYRDDLLWAYSEVEQDNDWNLRGTVIIRNLLENDRFRLRFIRRFQDLLNWHFRASDVEKRLNELTAAHSDDDGRDRAIWSISEEHYQQQLDIIRRFIRERPGILLEQLNETFSLGSPVSIDLAVSPAGAGKISVNGLMPSSLPTTGTYFKGTSISLAGIAAPGYRFARWASPEQSTDPEIAVVLDSDTNVVAIFETATD